MSRLILFCALLSPACALIVKTNQGPIRGLDVETPYGPVSTFLGVPFAQPPLGPLRFEAPIPPLYSSSVYNATEKKPSCPGIHLDMSPALQLDFGDADEDCLYLNMWAPANASNLPIVLYVHGGSFVTGSGNWFAYDGTRMAARANVIFITINMRLGVLGFLHLPGMSTTNVGLRDILRSLDWARENAEAFGGDPNQITLWGQSAGAIGIDILLKTSVLDGLVHRVILQGGTSGTGLILLKVDGLYASLQLAYGVGCDSDESNRNSTAELLACLRKVPWQDMIAELDGSSPVDRVSIQPFVDNDLIFEDSISSPRVASSVKDILILNDELEGFLFVDYFFRKLYQVNKVSETDWVTALKVIFKLLMNMPYKATQEMIRQYVPKDVIEAEFLDEMRDIILRKNVGYMFTDPVFFCPAENRAMGASDNGARVYRGEFHFRPGYSSLPEWASMSHAEELPLLHGNIHLYKPGVKGLSGAMLEGFANVTESDFKFSDLMIELLRTFFHGRKPKIPGSEKEWPLYTKANPQIVYMAPNNFTVVKGPKSDKCGLWEPYIVASPKEDTVPTTKAPEVIRSTTESISENVIGRGKVLRRTQSQNASDIVSAQLSILMLFCSLAYFRSISLT